ncbi:hypothetical protein ACP70R_020328 [Stipagrostis hirtigluma subsp. patula]
MDGDDPTDWLTVALTYFALALMYGSLLAMAISEVAAWLRRWRSRRACSLAVDRLLDAVPDVPYHRLAAGPDEGETSDYCVICMVEYGGGDTCFVLPGCEHMFHRDCVATWLRQGKNTCPVCRATVAIPGEQLINTADNMV